MPMRTGAHRLQHNSRTPRRTAVAASFSAGPANALYRHRRIPGFLGDQAILFLDRGARRLVAVEAAQQLGRNTAVGPLRAVFIDHVEEGELCARCWFACHVSILVARYECR